MPNESHTSPLLSIHLFNISRTTAHIGYTNPAYRNPDTPRAPAFELGTVQQTNLTNVTFDEQVLVIPVDDVVSICYRTTFKKDFAHQTTITRRDEACGGEDCCLCCGDAPVSNRQQFVQHESSAKRAIIVSIEYARYRKLQAPSLVRAMGERVRFDPTMMVLEVLHFYLLFENDLDPARFNYQRNQAEMLSCLITHIKQMASTRYPSEQELRAIVDLNRRQLFGAEILETTMDVQRVIPQTQPVTTQPTA